MINLETGLTIQMGPIRQS